ncbi:Transcriptional regulator, PadR family [Dehalobacter sp. UNSWDHB]|uniref:PadR family transcriptional regulator n=1 Tax=Dehalobacter sp. UNSWDHB TaxID=1339256 RepID=UPI00038787C8|nr:helix-turn-helix transcriptional regulator [Dehalobacter sp. UNSWDHB]EQB22708.1 Transcriptional regulator, PadR family [Dehalobacter sp. UNSWDHB]
MESIGQNLINNKGKCSCEGYNLDKLIQPKILVLLNKHHEGLHGYRIIEVLNQQPLWNEPADSTGIYRALKTMEDKKLLQSDWDTSGAGPAKKIYRITETGRTCLANWVKTLKKYQESILQILSDYEN